MPTWKAAIDTRISRCYIVLYCVYVGEIVRESGSADGCDGAGPQWKAHDGNRRRNLIAESIAASGSVTTEELVGRFSVSVMTIWRDLTALEENGLLRKVRVGRCAVDLRGGEEPLYTSKQVINLDLKEAIALTLLSILCATATSSSWRPAPRWPRWRSTCAATGS